MAQEITKQAVPVKTATTRSDVEGLMERLTRLHDAVERRAFSLFQENGWNFGHELCHWLQAERELLLPVRLELKETDKALILTAEVPGFSEKDLEVNVENDQVFITGRKTETKEEKKEGKTVYSERRSNQIFRSFILPIPVDPDKVEANIKNGLLEIKLPKAEVQKKIPIRTQAA
ncbi:MAG: Hsp20 family protein [Acidobacteriales bacterium]|nr:Hsp20 family protein [Terriglobales bacterium]